MTRLLEIGVITKTFGGVRALDRVSLDVRQGEALGLIGPNGAGKSTLFNIICGMRPDTGRVLFKGEDITAHDSAEICRRGVGRTFQLTRPFGNLAVQDNVAAALLFGRDGQTVAGFRAAKEEAYAILELVRLHHRAKSLAKDLLLAERRRLELARALGTGPALLLLDEAMAGLNPTEANELVDIIQTIKQEFGLTLLLIEHVMKLVSALCQRIVVLNFGRKIADGLPQEVLQHHEVVGAYLGEEGA